MGGRESVWERPCGREVGERRRERGRECMWVRVCGKESVWEGESVWERECVGGRECVGESVWRVSWEGGAGWRVSGEGERAGG